MISERKVRRFQVGLLLAAGALFAFYWFGYRNLGAWTQDLDKPTADAWKRLVTAAQGNPHVRALDDQALQQGVEQMRQAATLLQQTARAAHARIAFDAETRAHLDAEFQLLDFDQARLRVATELRQKAAAGKIVIAEPVLNGLPEFDPELTPPALHWAQLAFARQLLATALAATPRAVSNLTMLPVKTHLTGDGRPALLAELPMRLELTGSPASLQTFLSSLPLTGEEFKAAGLPGIPGKDQPLFIDRLILRNIQPNPTETSLEIVVAGFCEPPKPEALR